MSYQVQVFLKNNSFSEEYANEKHEGKDSPENIRFEWEDEFRLTDETDVVEILRETPYFLTVEMEGSGVFSYEIKDVIQFVFHGKEDVTTLVFSEKCVDEYVFDHDKKKLTVFLNDDEVVENPVIGIYIVLSDFPEDLRS